MKKASLLFTYAFLFSITSLKAQDVKIEMSTKYGSIVAELYPDKAPISCENFIKYIHNDKFEGANFYRVVRMDNQPNSDVKIEVIQGGLGFDVEDSPYPPIIHETTKSTGLLHKNGTLSMARSKPGTASSEFFICIGDQPELDFEGKRNPDGQGFAAFGQIIEGMDVVRKIQQQKDQSQMLLEKVEISAIKMLN